MTISATVVADSISEQGIRLVSLQLRYPKFIHGELMTHRVFSRNAASSRAIPVERMIQDVLDDPAMPVYWGKNQKGMQANEEHSEDTVASLRAHWLAGRHAAVDLARTLMQDGLHKQIANRVLEPWFHINTLVTATEWSNFFELRLHKDAQPEMRALAEAMKASMDESAPKLLLPGEWHLPYVTDSEIETATRQVPDDPFGNVLLKLSVARCARVSYLTQDGIEPKLEQDLELYERLVGSSPLHASPAEHQATPDSCLDVMGVPQWQHKDQWRNFKGWRQYRAFID